ncbi:hypothetical protein MKZ38_002110 [Zalerion maritima]|uniref:Uncharacterized protein n=1 Tax=Zalerion maritima TaxID=339359 RepID=A0AAD5RPI2_9PEZI|nr:hypothetical protein MKZ38_002110 [Zalerion maritima]
MPPKSSTSAAASRRKSGKAAPAPAANNTPTDSAPHLLVTLKVNLEKLRAIVDPASMKPEPSPSKDSPATSTTIAGAPVVNGTENPSENPSNAGTPAPSQAAPGVPGTPAVEMPKKKGVKRAVQGPNGEPKPRGKPGPKKKARLDDGTIDPNQPRASHKLGPKANQGAINAGLRALDRSGKPTRKWTKKTFTLKSFTGEVWELSRWRTNPKPKPVEPAKEEVPAAATATAPVSAEGSNKENKDAPSQPNKSDNNTPSTADVDMKDVPPSAAAVESPATAPTGTSTPAPPAPAPVAAAS